MLYEQLKDLSNEKFRRRTGVQKQTFEKMVEVLTQEDKLKKAKGGRKNKLSIANQLLLTLEYMREYRTYFHVASSYGVSESSAFKTIKWVEDTLIKHPVFSLPGKKALLKEDMNDVMMVDATETPIQRPKKNKKNTILVKRRDIL